MKGKEKIMMWRKVKRVKVLEREAKLGIGSGVYDVKDLDSTTAYDVYGCTWMIFEDRSREFCYILRNDEGALVLKATKRFEVVE